MPKKTCTTLWIQCHFKYQRKHLDGQRNIRQPHIENWLFKLLPVYCLAKYSDLNLLPTDRHSFYSQCSEIFTWFTACLCLSSIIYMISFFSTNIFYERNSLTMILYLKVNKIWYTILILDLCIWLPVIRLYILKN